MLLKSWAIRSRHRVRPGVFTRTCLQNLTAILKVQWDHNSTSAGVNHKSRDPLAAYCCPTELFRMGESIRDEKQSQ